MMMPDPTVTAVREPDGRWLVYCDQYRVASYGVSREDALEHNRNMVAEVSRNPEWLASPHVAIPDLDDEDFAGPELIKVVARWTGVSERSIAQHDDDE